ncbi:MAG: 30S ribosome-binding factor RbfA [Planctomycetes bacterium]|nr:30S ribosome-binding factor RbfA [Planctomycetota bacterium]
MPNQHRLQMVARELLREISVIVNFEMKDPRIGMVTVTKVEPASDMKTAKVYVSTMAEGKDRETALKGLGDARNFIRAQLRARMKGVRYIPELTFRFDESIAGAIRVSKLIDQVAKERQEKGETERSS